MTEEWFTRENLPQHPPVDLAEYPEDVREPIHDFCDLYGFRPPRKSGKGSDYAMWIRAARELADACGEFRVREVLEPIFIQWNKDLHDPNTRTYDVVGPMSLKGLARQQAALMRTQSKPVVEQYEPVFTRLASGKSLVEDD